MDSMLMDWDDFERKAANAIPDQPLKAKRCWVGVFRHDQDPQQPFTELDFTWMLGHGVSLSSIMLLTLRLDNLDTSLTQTENHFVKTYLIYEQRAGTTDFFLACRRRILDKSAILRDIVGRGAKLVVFRTVQTSASPPPEAITPTPLQKPSSASGMTDISPIVEPQQKTGFAASLTCPDRL